MENQITFGCRVHSCIEGTSGDFTTTERLRRVVTRKSPPFMRGRRRYNRRLLTEKKEGFYGRRSSPIDCSLEGKEERRW